MPICESQTKLMARISVENLLKMVNRNCTFELSNSRKLLFGLLKRKSATQVLKKVHAYILSLLNFFNQFFNVDIDFVAKVEYIVKLNI